MITWQIEISRPTPSGNAIRHKHWRATYNEQKWWARQLSLLVIAHKIPAATGKRNVTIGRIGKRNLDIDNLYAGLKPVLDAMRQAGLIRDDDEAHLGLTAFQRRTESRQPAFTIITLADA